MGDDVVTNINNSEAIVSITDPDASMKEESDVNTEHLMSLFGGDHSETELTGVDKEADEKKEAAKEKEEGKDKEVTKPEDKKAKKPDKDDDEKKKAADAESEDDGNDKKSKEKTDDKPPEGFVPLQALQEERQRRQSLAAELAEYKTTAAELRADMNALKAKVATGKADDEHTDSGEEEFKVLSDAEFAELQEEDPVAAQTYIRKEQLYLHKQAKKEAQEEQAKAKIHEAEVAIEKAVTSLKSDIPDLYKEGSELPRQLASFAIDNGFSADFIEALSDPRTMIYPADSDDPVFLGEGATGLIRMLNGLRNVADGKTLDDLFETKYKDRIEEERKKITAEIVKKVKSGGADFVSLEDVPGSEETPKETSGVLTEAQLVDLAIKDEKKYMEYLTGTQT